MGNLSFRHATSPKFLTKVIGSVGAFLQLSVRCTLLLMWVSQREHRENQGAHKETVNCSVEEQQQQQTRIERAEKNKNVAEEKGE